MGLLQSVDYVALAPLLLVAGTALVALVVDLFTPARRQLPAWVSVGGLLAALGWTAVLAGESPRGTFCVPPGRLPEHLGSGELAGSCSYVVDDVAVLLHVVVLAAAAVVVLLSAAYVDSARLPAGEYHFLLLCSVAGMVALSASRDLLMLVVALEVVSLPGFVLAGLRRDDPRSSESAVKFFLISVLSTAVTLLGMSLVYGLTGSIHLDRVASALTRAELDLPLLPTAVGLVVVGFGFKVSAVPFHFWAPDTYQGAPLPVAAFLAVASKAAGFAGLLAVLVLGFRPLAASWGPLLAVLAVASMTVGNLVALRQRDVVRLLAWSSIAQSGYILVPLGVAAAAAGRTDAALEQAVSAALGYLAIYAVMNLGAFACVVAAGGKVAGTCIADYRALARSAPLLAVAFAFFLACLAGLPPGLAGLFAKVVVFQAVVDAGVLWLAVVMAVNTVIGLYYYARLAALLFAPPTDATEPALTVTSPAVPAGSGTRPAAGVPSGVAVAVGLTAVAAVVIGFVPQAVLGATSLVSFQPG